MAIGDLNVLYQVESGSIPQVLPDDPLYAIAIPTLRGVAARPTLVTSEAEFKQYFGGEHPDSNDSLSIIAAIQKGVKFVVARQCHYTDTSDKSTIVGTKATATLTVATEDVVYNATEVGFGYNGVEITTSVAKNKKTGFVDILVKVPELPAPTLAQVRDLPQAPTTAELASANEILARWGVKLVSYTNFIPTQAAPVTLAGGVEDISLITDTDYVGNRLEGIGAIHSFSNVVGIWRVFTFNYSQAVKEEVLKHLDILLADDPLFARQTVTAEFQTNVATTIAEAQAQADLRDTEGYDTGYGSLFLATPVTLQHPLDEKRELQTDFFKPYIILRYKADLVSMQASPMDLDRFGFVEDVISLGEAEFDLGDTRYAREVADIYQQGLNYIGTRTAKISQNNQPAVVRTGYGFEGDKNLVIDQSLVISRKSAHDCGVEFLRRVKPLDEAMKGKNNAVRVWSDHAENIKQDLRDYFVNREAIFPGENEQTGWFVRGDQDAPINYTDADLEVNSVASLNDGFYFYEVTIRPIPIITGVRGKIKIAITVNAQGDVVNSSIT